LQVVRMSFHRTWMYLYDSCRDLAAGTVNRLILQVFSGW